MIQYIHKFDATTKIPSNKGSGIGVGVVSGILYYRDANGTVRGLADLNASNGFPLAAPVAGGSALTLTSAHHGKTVALDTLAGTTITLPAATGSGMRVRFIVTVAPTSNQHRINVVGNDAFFGNIFGAQDGGATTESWEAGADADQINLNGTTTGGLKGDIIEIEDMVADGWHVTGHIAQTGAQATPFATGQVS